jgi:CubicO group peptidase (beta-lactamase class C family)
LLAVLGAGLMTAGRGLAASPQDDVEQRLERLEQEGRVSGLHALLVSRGGKLVVEHYERGEDWARAQPLGTVTFAPDVLHDLRSVSKGVVGLLYGIALADGRVPPPEARLYDQFPDYADLAKEPGRNRLTVHHVLSMTLGLEWDELTFPYGDPRNAETAMIASPDRLRFILGRPIMGEPGAKWTYCSGATALLGRLISRGTGEELLAYGRRVLFDPLGFGPAEWTTDEDGEPHAASGLRLLPRDMVKVGELALAGGAWNGKQVVPADWVKRATTPMVASSFGRSYGYHWYMGDVAAGAPSQPRHWLGGVGWGGQSLFAFPALDLVVGINCGNYAKPGREQGDVVRAVLTEAVLPSVV